MICPSKRPNRLNDRAGAQDLRFCGIAASSALAPTAFRSRKFLPTRCRGRRLAERRGCGRRAPASSCAGCGQLGPAVAADVGAGVGQDRTIPDRCGRSGRTRPSPFLTARRAPQLAVRGAELLPATPQPRALPLLLTHFFSLRGEFPLPPGYRKLVEFGRGSMLCGGYYPTRLEVSRRAA